MPAADGAFYVLLNVPTAMDSRQLIERLVREHRVAVCIAQRVLARFKAAFPQWPLVARTNSVVDITTIGVEVWPAQGCRLVRDTCLALDSDDWQTRLTSALEQNARRGSPHAAGQSASERTLEACPPLERFLEPFPL